MINSKIEWTGNTVNFWSGCQKVSEGCKYCYMYRAKENNRVDPTKVVRASNFYFQSALSWNAPTKIFTCSMSDFFIEDADQWRAEAWDVIYKTPQHSWQVLTKRPERIKDCLPLNWANEGYSNVWLGVSIACEAEKHRLKTLQELKNNESRFLTFLSVEPLIGDINFLDTTENENYFKNLDWVIIGGESGNADGKYRYRACELVWIENIIQHCKKHGIAVFVKQVGTDLAKKMSLKDNYFGGNINEWPENIRVREFPKK